MIVADGGNGVTDGQHGTYGFALDELVVENPRELHTVQAVSVETNPDDLDRDGIWRLREAGVNRVSVGVQSFDDALLSEMQRLGPYGSGAAIAERLRKRRGTFETLNVDMIFNFPDQDEQSLRRDLESPRSESDNGELDALSEELAATRRERGEREAALARFEERRACTGLAP